MSYDMGKILIIGACGQIGSELTVALRDKYGSANVVAAGHNTEPPDNLVQGGPFEYCDVLEKESVGTLIEKYSIDSIFNLAAILSVKGEETPQTAFEVNVWGLYNTLELGLEYELNRIVVPSSIGVFGPEAPKKNTPNETILRPTSMYGVTKVTGELLGNYYFHKFGLDVRGLRLPGIISYKTLPGGGTTDYAVEAFYKAIEEGHYDFFVREDTVLPLMYMPDCVRALIMLAEVDIRNLNHHCDFNVAAVSFSAGELATAIEQELPDFTYSFVPDDRQKIADSWPNSLDDSAAREEWGWCPQYQLEDIVQDMVSKLSEKLV